MSSVICIAQRFRIVAAKQVKSAFFTSKPATSISFRSFGGASHSGDDHGHHSDVSNQMKSTDKRVELTIQSA